MRLGSAGEWGAASQLMDRGVNEVGNLARGGTIQEIKTQNIKKFATDILTLMQQGDPEAITPEFLMERAEMYDLDPVEASGALNLIMGFKDKMKGRAEKQQLYKGLSDDDKTAVGLKEHFDFTKQKVEDPNIALGRALDINKKVHDIKQRPVKEGLVKTEEDRKTGRYKMAQAAGKRGATNQQNKVMKAIKQTEKEIYNLKTGKMSEGLGALFGQIGISPMGVPNQDSPEFKQAMLAMTTYLDQLKIQLSQGTQDKFNTPIPTINNKLKGSMDELMAIGRQ